MTENEKLTDKLRKVLALTTSPVEGEAQAAAAMLAKLLTQHNLSIADLEKKGASAPGVRKDSHDLGKAAFTWKLNLAEAIADHYYCYPLVDRTKKTVAFVGRPDNVESLQMLYGWIIDQIKRISAEERRNHYVRTNEHIDPLRWQVNFGLGAVTRLRDRLAEMRRAQVSAETTALVLHHKSEISDWLEAEMGYRIDNRKTKQERENDERWAKYMQEVEARQAAADQREAERRATLTQAQRDAEDAEKVKLEAKETRESEKRRAKQNAKWNRQYERKSSRPVSPEQRRKDEEAYEARSRGRQSADRVNLQPFLDGNVDNKSKIQ